jgi:hypothetical protein
MCGIAPAIAGLLNDGPRQAAGFFMAPAGGRDSVEFHPERAQHFIDGFVVAMRAGAEGLVKTLAARPAPLVICAMSRRNPW